MVLIHTVLLLSKTTLFVIMKISQKISNNESYYLTFNKYHINIVFKNRRNCLKSILFPEYFSEEKLLCFLVLYSDSSNAMLNELLV